MNTERMTLSSDDADWRRSVRTHMAGWTGIEPPESLLAGVVAASRQQAGLSAQTRGLLQDHEEPSSFAAALQDLAAPPPPEQPCVADRQPAAPSGLAEIALQLRTRQRSCVEVLLESFSRIDACNHVVNAVIWQDRERGLARAGQMDALGRDAIEKLPLFGVPLAHKDMFHRRGHRMSGGSIVLDTNDCAATATVLTRLEEAGSITFAGLNMAELAQNATGHNVHFGHCRNPWNPDRITGGSSSGSGAAVAAGFTYGSLGSDTGGSVRLPASLCGVTGLKVTWSRVSRQGVMPMSFSHDTVGPLARSARDCALLLQCIAGPDAADPTCANRPADRYLDALDGDLRGVRLGMPVNIHAEDVDPAVRQAVALACEVLAGRGAILQEVVLPDMPSIMAYSAIVPRVEAATLHAARMRDHPHRFSRQLAARLYAASDIPAVLYVEALSRRGALLRNFDAEVFGRVDAIVYPTIRIQAPTIEASDEDRGGARAAAIGAALVEGTRPVNYLGLPAISVPCGFDPNGVPIGMQIVARPFAESMLLRIADAYQADTAWHAMAPPPRN